jgi:hypothetical protein
VQVIPLQEDVAGHMRLSRDPADYERIGNDPAVLPFVVPAGVEKIDLTPFFNSPENIGILYRDCAFLVHQMEPGIYEVHSLALPHVRGAYVYAAASLSIRFMFFATGAMELLTRVPEGNVAATALSRKVGFSPEFTRPNAWLAADGPKEVTFYAMRYPEWVKHQDWLRESGEQLHAMLGEVEHDDDPAHDLYVGAAMEMVLSGQPDKACFLYNRWARFAGYEPIDIVAREPLTINVKSHLLTVDGGKVEVVTCQ